MSKKSFKNRMLQRRKDIPDKYQKFVTEQHFNSEITSTVMVGYNIGWEYIRNGYSYFKKEKAGWTRIVNVSPTCVSGSNKIAYDYNGLIVNSKLIEIDVEEYVLGAMKDFPWIIQEKIIGELKAAAVNE